MKLRLVTSLIISTRQHKILNDRVKPIAGVEGGLFWMCKPAKLTISPLLIVSILPSMILSGYQTMGHNPRAGVLMEVPKRASTVKLFVSSTSWMPQVAEAHRCNRRQYANHSVTKLKRISARVFLRMMTGQKTQNVMNPALFVFLP